MAGTDRWWSHLNRCTGTFPALAQQASQERPTKAGRNSAGAFSGKLNHIPSYIVRYLQNPAGAFRRRLPLDVDHGDRTICSAWILYPQRLPDDTHHVTQLRL